MIVTTNAVVLRTMRYRETSRIAVLYTRELGKISVIAKGARDGKSRLGGALQPMNLVACVLYVKETRELQLITQCDLVVPMHALGADLEKMGPAMAALELTEAVSPPGEPSGEIFDLLAETLRAVSGATKHPGNALYYFELHLLGLIGFRPLLTQCASCGKGVETAGEGDLRMSRGGILCRACSRREPGLEAVSAAALAALRRLQESASPAAATHMVLDAPLRGEIARLLRHYLQAHVEGLRTLRSEAVFSSL
ncbi:MAG TPA: DNA repair protein RecO [Bacteroidota bacterium]|nr:DNA repair protein RecO [Bacteroidota bacterium]